MQFGNLTAGRPPHGRCAGQSAALPWRSHASGAQNSSSASGTAIPLVSTAPPHRPGGWSAMPCTACSAPRSTSPAPSARRKPSSATASVLTCWQCSRVARLGIRSTPPGRWPAPAPDAISRAAAQHSASCAVARGGQPDRRQVAAATGGLVQAESLQSSRHGQEKQHRRREHTEIKMNRADESGRAMVGWHDLKIVRRRSHRVTVVASCRPTLAPRSSLLLR